jgi:hypothetical protein
MKHMFYFRFPVLACSSSSCLLYFSCSLVFLPLFACNRFLVVGGALFFFEFFHFITKSRLKNAEFPFISASDYVIYLKRTKKNPAQKFNPSPVLSHFPSRIMQSGVSMRHPHYNNSTRNSAPFSIQWLCKCPDCPAVGAILEGAGRSILSWSVLKEERS